MEHKQWWLDLAEVTCKLQVFPRLMLLLSFVAVCGYAWHAPMQAIQVVRAVPDPTLAQAIVAGIIVATVPLMGQIFTQVMKLNRTGCEERE